MNFNDLEVGEPQHLSGLIAPISPPNLFSAKDLPKPQHIRDIYSKGVVPRYISVDYIIIQISYDSVAYGMLLNNK